MTQCLQNYDNASVNHENKEQIFAYILHRLTTYRTIPDWLKIQWKMHGFASISFMEFWLGSAGTHWKKAQA